MLQTNWATVYRTLQDIKPVSATAASPIQADDTALAGSASFEPSGLAELSLSRGWLDFSLTSDQTSLAYRKDNSLALRVSSQTNVSLHAEDTTVEASFTAESLGLSKANFPDNKPITLSFTWEAFNSTIKHTQNVQKVQTTRSAQDILSDLMTSLQKIFKGKGDKSIYLTLDKEAMQALMGDSHIKDIMNEVVGLITMINSMRTEGGERQRYQINLIGKGQPYVDVQENTSVQADVNRVTFKLTIQPPQGQEN